MQYFTICCIWHFLWVMLDNPWPYFGLYFRLPVGFCMSCTNRWPYTLRCIFTSQPLHGCDQLIKCCVSLTKSCFYILCIERYLCYVFFCPYLVFKRSLLETLIRSRDLEFRGDCVHWVCHIGLIGVLLGLSLHVHNIVIGGGGSIGVGDVTERCSITTGPILG